MPIATYTFLPWLRRGISNQLAAAGTGAARATVSVSLAVQSERARRDLPAVTVHLLGPGDVTAVQAQQIIRTEPRAGVTDFEPNYLAAIDFYDEDFPWRYTPVPPGGTTHRLAPWIVLVVLADAEFTRRQGAGTLSSFVLTSDRATVRHLSGGWPGVGMGARPCERGARVARRPRQTLRSWAALSA